METRGYSALSIYSIMNAHKLNMYQYLTKEKAGARFFGAGDAMILNVSEVESD